VHAAPIHPTPHRFTYAHLTAPHPWSLHRTSRTCRRIGVHRPTALHLYAHHLQVSFPDRRKRLRGPGSRIHARKKMKFPEIEHALVRIGRRRFPIGARPPGGEPTPVCLHAPRIHVGGVGWRAVQWCAHLHGRVGGVMWGGSAHGDVGGVMWRAVARAQAARQQSKIGGRKTHIYTCTHMSFPWSNDPTHSVTWGRVEVASVVPCAPGVGRREQCRPSVRTLQPHRTRDRATNPGLQ